MIKLNMILPDDSNETQKILWSQRFNAYPICLIRSTIVSFEAFGYQTKVYQGTTCNDGCLDLIGPDGHTVALTWETIQW